MVKTTAPLLSLAASGTIGDAITFAQWKGRPYARVRVDPANPRSAAQVTMRAMMGFISQGWAAIPAWGQDNWTAPAAAENIPPFNFYIKENLQRWPNFQPPSMIYPATDAGPCAVLAGETATPGQQHITVSATCGGAPAGIWGVLIFRSTTTPIVTAWSNCIAVLPLTNNETFNHRDSPLQPGTYYYNFRNFQYTGFLGDQETEVNATVPA